jgi:hypothetical protein
MKIQGIKGQRTEDKGAAKKTKSSEKTNFFSLLERQLLPAEPTTAVQATDSIENSTVPAQLRLDGVFISENTIDLLESFEKCLGNIDLSPEDLMPIIDALEVGTTSLLDIKEQLSADDPLAQLIDQVATISIIETEKFRRGDYS